MTPVLHVEGAWQERVRVIVGNVEDYLALILQLCLSFVSTEEVIYDLELRGNLVTRVVTLCEIGNGYRVHLLDLVLKFGGNGLRDVVIVAC